MPPVPSIVCLSSLDANNPTGPSLSAVTRSCIGPSPGNSLICFGSVTASGVQGDNAVKLFTSLSGSDQISPADVNGGIQARSSERTKASYYFCRVKSTQYNYSNNPSFVTGSEGRPAYDSFVNDPQSYITTVGLYNNANELLAVAKLSQPLLKNYTREALIRVKLDF